MRRVCSGELKGWLKQQDIEHARGAPYHPQTQGKIERYHRSMKNAVKLENYYYPWELEKAIAEWVKHYNHESLDNVTPADVYEGRRNDILDQRALVKARKMTKRKIHNLQLAGQTCRPLMSGIEAVTKIIRQSRSIGYCSVQGFPCLTYRYLATVGRGERPTPSMVRC